MLLNMNNFIKTTFFFAVSIFLAILLFSCSGSLFFYQRNKTPKAISIKNASVTKTFLLNEKHKKISLIQIVPTNAQNKPITILVVPPKGGNSGTLSEVISPLVSKGYEIYLFDYQGYGTSDGKADTKNVVTDAQLVLDYVASNKKTNTKLLLWGFSIGGNLAVKLASDNPSKIDALIIEGAFTSHPEVVKSVAPKGLKWVAKFIRSPYPSKQLIKNVHIPVLIIHSLNDKTCPYSMGETLYENANQPKSFLQLSGDHCHGLQQETDKYLNYLELFLTGNNIK